MADLLDELHSNLGHGVERELQVKYNLDDVGGILFNERGGGKSAGSGCLGMLLARISQRR